MKKILSLALVLAIATACSRTEEPYLDGPKLLVESVQENAQDYTKADWEKTSEQFTKLKDSYNKFNEQMTSSERDEIVKLESTYVVLELKRISNDLKEGVKNAFEEAKGTAEGIAKDVKEDTQKAVKRGEEIVEGIKGGLKD